MRTPKDVVHMRVVGIYRSARGREGSPNGGDRTLAFWLPGTTDPRQRRGWEQTAAATGVSERSQRPVCRRAGAVATGEHLWAKMPPDARAARVHVCLVIVRGLCSRAWFQRINAEKFKRWTWFMFVFFDAAGVSSEGAPPSALPSPHLIASLLFLMFWR